MYVTATPVIDRLITEHEVDHGVIDTDTAELVRENRDLLDRLESGGCGCGCDDCCYF